MTVIIPSRGADDARRPAAGTSPEAPAGRSAPPADEAQPFWRRRRGGLTCATAYLLAALAMYWPVQPFSTTKLVSCGCYDVAEQVWFLAWTPHALLHGLNPFFTRELNFPFGANLAANTTMPLLGLLASPLSLSLGPVAAYNVLIRLALFSSALAMCLVLRHYSCRWPVAFLGGLVYGFSPYMLAQGSLHLNLCFVPLFPLLVVAVDNLLSGRHSPRRDGLVLGGLATAQYFISSELLADLAVLALLAVVVLALRFPRAARRRAGGVVLGLCWALLPFVVLAGYPIVFGLVGPQHYVASWQVTNGNETIRNDLLSPLVPTPAELLAPSSSASQAAVWVGGVGENGGYLGIPLIGCWAAALAWALWSATRRSGRAASAAGRALLFGMLVLVAFVLSLGPTLQVHGVGTGVTLPFALFAHLPLLQVAVSARFSLFVSLGVVLTVAPALDAAWARGAARGASRPAPISAGRPSSAPGRLALAALGLVVVIALLPLLPARSLPSAAVGVPAYFTSAAVRSIPSGSTVLVYPYPYEQDDFSMVWQAESGFRFRLLGGYVLTALQTHPPAGAGQGGGDVPPTLDPPIVQILFYSANGSADATGIHVVLAPWATTQIEQFVRKFRVGTIIEDPAAYPAPAAPGSVVRSEIGYGPDYHPGAVTRIFRAMYGQPVTEGPLRIWYRADVRPVAAAWR